MSWTTPKTWSDNELVTASLLNTHLRDNLNALLNELTPAGTIIAYAGIINPPTNPVPVGWLQCDGTAVSRTTYSRLFTAVGTTFGVGDGSTTFNVPDMRGRLALGKDNQGGTSANRVTATQADNLGQGAGSETHTLTILEMPAHAHTVTTFSANASGPAAGWWPGQATGNAGRTSDVIGGSGAHNNMPPYVTMNYLVKI